MSREPTAGQPGAAAAAAAHPRRGLAGLRRRAALGALLAGAVVLLVLVAGLAERAILERGERYPRWLASAELPAPFDARTGQLDPQFVQGMGPCMYEGTLEIFRKQGQVVLRCGYAWYWPGTRTFILPDEGKEWPTFESEKDL